MKRWGYWIVIGMALLAVVALIGWAYTYIPLMTACASEEWSRGRLLGATPVNVRVDIQAASDGGAFLTWVDLDNRLRVVRLGTRGRVVAERTPALGTDVPREPRLLVGSEDEIHLIWRETGGSRSLLTYAQLDDAASVQAGPLLLSPVGDEARSPCLAFNRRGEVEVFWAGQAGIYHVTLSAEGEMQGEPVLLVEDGRDVGVQVDQAGIFHLAWLQNTGSRLRAIYYASFDPERNNLSQPEEMSSVFLRGGQFVQSLDVGIDTGTGYILWVVQDLRDVVSSAQYAFFPLEIPRQKKVRDLQLDGGGNPMSPWAVRGQHETQLVALSETVMTPGGPQLQIGVIALRGEQSPGDYARDVSPISSPSPWVQVANPIALHVLSAQYAQGDWPDDQYIVTASERPSIKPSLAVDAQGDLYLSWLETGDFGIYRVAYASTAAGVKEVYNALTLWDVTDRALDFAIKLFLAVGLMPVLPIYWSLVPLGWLLVYHLVTGRESLTVPGAWVALGIAVVLEVTSTYLLYPHRSRMSPALQWTAPLATAAIALLVAMLAVRKRDEKPLLGAFFVFAICYGLIQTLLFVLLR